MLCKVKLAMCDFVLPHSIGNAIDINTIFLIITINCFSYTFQNSNILKWDSLSTSICNYNFWFSYTLTKTGPNYSGVGLSEMRHSGYKIEMFGYSSDTGIELGLNADVYLYDIWIQI